MVRNPVLRENEKAVQRIVEATVSMAKEAPDLRDEVYEVLSGMLISVRQGKYDLIAFLEGHEGGRENA